jgi:hypothetical protein
MSSGHPIPVFVLGSTCRSREHKRPDEEAEVKEPVPKKEAEKAAAVLVHELRPVTDTVKKAVKQAVKEL